MQPAIGTSVPTALRVGSAAAGQPAPELIIIIISSVIVIIIITIIITIIPPVAIWAQAILGSGGCVHMFSHRPHAALPWP